LFNITDASTQQMLNENRSAQLRLGYTTDPIIRTCQKYVNPNISLYQSCCSVNSLSGFHFSLEL